MQRAAVILLIACCVTLLYVQGTARLFSLGVWVIHSIFAALANSAGEVDEWLKSTVC